VAVVQYTFTNKQYIEQHNRHKQYIEQHNSLIRKSADRAPSLELYTGVCLTTEEKARKTPSQGSQRMSVGVPIYIVLPWKILSYKVSSKQTNTGRFMCRGIPVVDEYVTQV